MKIDTLQTSNGTDDTLYRINILNYTKIHEMIRYIEINKTVSLMIRGLTKRFQTALHMHGYLP